MHLRAHAFPIIKKQYGEQAPFWVSSVGALFAASFSVFLLPEVGPDENLKENTAFLEYQASIGFDSSKLVMLMMLKINKIFILNLKK